jgi:hypothetical protein
MGLVRAYPLARTPPARNPAAVDLDRAIASLRRTLPKYIDFLALGEDFPNIPETYMNRLQKLRRFRDLLYDLFPPEGRRPKKREARWQQVAPDKFEYQAGTPWHDIALYLFACYQDLIDPSCGISRDGAPVRFIQSALVQCRIGHFGLDAIEKALARAKNGLFRSPG